MSIAEHVVVATTTRPVLPPPPGYAAVDRDVINDQTLSLEARGVYCTIAAFPGGVTVHELRRYVRPGPDNRDLQVYLAELTEAGCVVVL